MAQPELHDGEKLIRIVHEHWMRFVVPVVVYVLLVGVVLLLFALSGVAAHHEMWLSHASFLAALLLLFAAHHWFFAMLLSEVSGYIIITDRRVLFLQTRLLLADEMHEYAFDKMKTVIARKRGILQNILHYGTLTFEAGARIPYVSHPNSIARDIQAAMGMR